MGKLLPCPFCGNASNPDPQNDDCPVPAGSRADGEFYLTIWCEACGAEGGKRLTRADAITAWNTRPRTEWRGEGEPVAWRHEYRPGRYHLSTVAQEGYQPLYASPIREPEISRTALIETMRQHIKADAVGLAPAVIAHFLVGFEEAADAILNLAPVGGRGKGWRPIETAPKDGTKVDLWCRAPGLSAGPGRVPDCWFSAGRWWAYDEHGDDQCRSQVHNATHWQPIPPSPQEQANGD